MDGRRPVAVLDLAGQREGGVDRDGEALATAWNWKLCDAAVSMPTTLPVALTRGPPESPGWMLASVWMRPVSCSALAPPSSLAVIVWLRAVTLPLGRARRAAGTAGVADADDRVTLDDVDELPRGAVCRPEAPWSCSTATSAVRS